MSYKVKSLIYFVCFLTATFAYYAIGDDAQFENATDKEVAELSMERVTFDETQELK